MVARKARIQTRPAFTLLLVLALAAGTTLVPWRASAAIPAGRWQGTWTKFTQPADPGNAWLARNYYVYVPPAKVLRTPYDRSLMVFLHGTTQTAENAALMSKWNDLADSEGFIVAYPEQSDGGAAGFDNCGANGGRFWAWGRAAYESRDNCEMRVIADITKRVTSEYKVDPGRVYIGGVSAGAIMATVMAASYPELYNGVASWAGCAYLCADANGDLGFRRMGDNARVVPAILFAGTADYLVNIALSEIATTGWTGMNDQAAQRHGRRVSRTPTDGPKNYNSDLKSLEPSPNTGPPNDDSRGDAGTCVYASRVVTQPNNRKGNNPCPGATLGWKNYPFTVTKFGYVDDPADVVVESWLIHGVSHNYTGGSNDGTYADPTGPDTTLAAWRFLDAHARPTTGASGRQHHPG